MVARAKKAKEMGGHDIEIHAHNGQDEDEGCPRSRERKIGRESSVRAPRVAHSTHAHTVSFTSVVAFLGVVALLWFFFPSRQEFRTFNTAFSEHNSQHEMIIAECGAVPDNRAATFQKLSDVLQLTGDVDEFSKASSFLQPVSIVRKLVADGLIPLKNTSAAPGSEPRKILYAVNFGARDGKGSGGNTDPTYPIFADLGFHGMAVEASNVFWKQLKTNLAKLPVRPVQSFITVANAVGLIERAGLPFVDVFKIDIDSFDCDVMPVVLRSYRPALVIAEYNVYFPPPIKMKLVPSASGYDSNKRGTTYECSIQFLNDDVMRPLGYVLLQLDWQNVIYARREIAAALGMHGGVDVQVRLCVSRYRVPCLLCATLRRICMCDMTRWSQRAGCIPHGLHLAA